MTEDIRWVLRFDHFKRALEQLAMAFELMDQRELSELELQGLIQTFKNNYELAWHVIKDFYQYQGAIDIEGSRDAFKMAFARGLISNGDIWLDMIKTRQLILHAYHQATNKVIIEAIIDDYYEQFQALKTALTRQLGKL